MVLSDHNNAVMDETTAKNNTTIMTDITIMTNITITKDLTDRTDSDKIVNVPAGSYILITDGVPNGEGHMKVSIDWDKTFIKTITTKLGIFDQEEQSAISQFNTYMFGMICGIMPSSPPVDEDEMDNIGAGNTIIR